MADVPITKLCKFYLRLLHPKEISRKVVKHFFFYWRLHWFLKCQFRADPPKDFGIILIFWCLLHGVFFFEKIFLALRKILGYCSHFFLSYLFCLLKSCWNRECAYMMPPISPKPKAGYCYNTVLLLLLLPVLPAITLYCFTVHTVCTHNTHKYIKHYNTGTVLILYV